jgi:protein-L-isoaspartate(D-aspartate) O-methyltransferase
MIFPEILTTRLTAGLCGLAVLWHSTAVLANEFETLRNKMVDEAIVAAGIKNQRVVESARNTPRHEFVALNQRGQAYYDMALPIGNGQTISPPFVVSYMTEQLDPQPTDKVLEIGTGSGYQAAILSPLVDQVYTIEIVKPLGQRAARTLKRLGYKNVHPMIGDGYKGWPEHAPFDKIIVTCSPEKVPQPLVEQLREGGRMIVPVGERYQQMLYLFEKKDGKLVKIGSLPTLFVPMTGEAEKSRVVKPDPNKPSIANGGFEEVATEAVTAPAGSAASEEPARRASSWHYQRQLELVEAAEAPEGKQYALFKNIEPGRPAQALQGLAVDGREVRRLDVSAWVRGENVRPGPGEFDQPTLAIVFYDDNRNEAGYRYLRPWLGTFDWRLVKESVNVPVKAREAIVRVGLNGATGELAVDGLRIEAVK